MRRRVSLVLTLVSLIFGFTVLPAFCTEYMSGDKLTVPADRTIDDNLLAAGGSVDILGTIAGDLIAAGGSISMTGRVTMDVMAAGGTVEISGPVDDDLRAAGGNLRLAGKVGKNCSIAGGDVTVADTCSIGRDLEIAGGTVRIGGSVGRNVKAAGGDVTINGPVGGRVVVYANKLVIGPKAVIRGDLVYSSQEALDVSPTAKILGDTKKLPTPQPKPAKGGFWISLYGFVTLFIVGALIIALSPVSTRAAAERILSAPWISLLVGFLALFVTPLIILFLFVTFFGIPVSLILLAAYLISVYISRVFIAIAIGHLIFRRRGDASPYLELLVGLVILLAVTQIPYIGWLISLFALLFGLGGLAISRFVMMRDLRRESRM